MHKIAPLLTALLVMCLFSCSREKVLFISDIFYYETSISGFPASDASIKPLKKKAQVLGADLDFIVFDHEKETINQLTAAAEGKKPGRIILSPLASVYIEDIRDVFPGIPAFVMTSKNDEDDGYSVVIAYDRIDAFKEAGRLAGELSAAAGGEETGAAAGIFYTGTERREREKEAFLETYLPHINRETWYEYSFDSLDVNPTLESVVSEINVKNPKNIVIFASSFNVWLIDRLSPEIRSVLATEDGLFYGLTVPEWVISVEEPLWEALEAAIKADLSSLPDRILINAKAIRINKGKMFDKEL